MSTTSTSESPWYPPFAAAAPGGVFPTPTTAVETPLVTAGLAELWRVPYEGCERLIASRSRLIALGSAGARAWSSSGDSGTALPVVGSHAVLDQAGTQAARLYARLLGLKSAFAPTGRQFERVLELAKANSPHKVEFQKVKVKS